MKEIEVNLISQQSYAITNKIKISINAINLMNDAKDQHGRYEFQDFPKSSVGRRYTINLNGRL